MSKKLINFLDLINSLGIDERNIVVINPETAYISLINDGVFNCPLKNPFEIEASTDIKKICTSLKEKNKMSIKYEPTIVVSDPKAEIIAERQKLKNHHNFYIGRPGSGKVKSCIVPNDMFKKK